MDAARGLTVFGVILLHVALMYGADLAVWYLRLRDFAFPLIVLTSFYVLSLSVVGHGRDVLTAASKRVSRLLVPACLWSLIYWYAWDPMVALLVGADVRVAPLPPWHLLAGGFMHLWYLMFLFYCSLILLVLLAAGRTVRIARPLCDARLWVVVAIAYIWWVRDPLVEAVAPLGQPGLASWLTFKRQSVLLAAYIPWGVAFGLAATHLSDAGKNPRVRYGVAAAAGIIAILYTSGVSWPYAREYFGISAFAVLVMPWAPPRFRWWPRLAAASYAVYILHYGIAQAVVLVAGPVGSATSAWSVLATAVVVYVICLAVVMAARRSGVPDWLLPRVPVGHG